MKTAIIHEWLDRLAGSERVVGEFLKLFPQADLFSLVDFLPDEERGFLQETAITTSFVQRLPWAKKHFRHYLPLMPYAVEQFDLTGYDLILSSHHAFAKGVMTGHEQLHISYVHTPMRYAWDLYQQYLRDSGLTHGLRSILVRAALHHVRMWDRLASDRVDAYIANSRYIAKRIHHTYRRGAYVIHPPVDVDAFPLQETKDDFFLAASRVVPYKRLDLIVQAFAKMPRRRLIVIGDGPGLEALRHQATDNVEILGFQPANVLAEYMGRARAFVFAAEEDFGIMPVEAQACGTPVIAFGRGGTTETVMAGRTGLFFSQQTPESLREAVQMFEQLRHRFVPERIRSHAENFRPERFRREMSELVSRLWDGFQETRAGWGNRRSAEPFPLDPCQSPRVAPASQVATDGYRLVSHAAINTQSLRH